MYTIGGRGVFSVVERVVDFKRTWILLLMLVREATPFHDGERADTVDRDDDKNLVPLRVATNRTNILLLPVYIKF